jgi:glutamine amidotransferase
MFYLALTFGLTTDPLGALARMAGFIEQTGKKHGIDETLWMTVAVSDGQTLYAVRYASDGEAPSLYHSRDMEDIYRINPATRQLLGSSTRVVVSEPIGRFAEMWQNIPQGSSVAVTGGQVEIRPFTPARS